MKKTKRTLRKKIFLSHISIVVVSILSIFIIFNLCLNFYIKMNAKKELMETAVSIENMMIGYYNEEKFNSTLENASDINKHIPKINKFVKDMNVEFNINYIILDSDKKILSPEKMDIKKYTTVESKLLSVLTEKNFILPTKVKEKNFYFDALGERYQAIIYPLKISGDAISGYIVVYSDLIEIKRLISIVNTILLIILVNTIFFSAIIANNIFKKISEPISQLSSYAKRLGERHHDDDFINYDTKDEIGQLTETMKIMSKKLFNYHNNMKIFIQNASHEMRTPLMSIQGYAEGIKYGVVDDNDKAVDIIIEESKRLSLLIDDLLFLSKIEATDEQFNIEELNLESIIYSCIEKVNGIAVKNNKKINFSVPDSPIIFEGDGAKLIRAIINILGNALRYCIENIDVALEKKGTQIIILIEDDGPGLNEDEINHIFDRFFKGKGGNYGLGLSITKSIIEKHGGIITAENKKSGGARFKIVL